VETLNLVESVARLEEIALSPMSHNGFPVVEDYNPDSVSYTLLGLRHRYRQSRAIIIATPRLFFPFCRPTPSVSGVARAMRRIDKVYFSICRLMALIGGVGL